MDSPVHRRWCALWTGVNVDHPSAVAVREEEPNCDLGKFDLTDDEFDIVMDCQKASGGDDVELKEVSHLIPHPGLVPLSVCKMRHLSHYVISSVLKLCLTFKFT